MIYYTTVMEKHVLNYRIIIEKERYKDGALVYAAYCPTLGVTDYADTVEEVLKSIKDGIELAIETLAKEKKEIPIDHTEEQIITSTQIIISSRIAAGIHV